MKDCEGNELKSGDYVKSKQGVRPNKIEIRDGLCWILDMPLIDSRGAMRIPCLTSNSMATSQWVKCPAPE